MRACHLLWLAAVVACASGGPPSRETMPAMAAMAGAPPAALPPADSAAALHLLNRLTFGPRPGDLAEVQRLGVGRWLERQLDPSRLPDSVERRVRESYPVAFLSPVELFERYPPPQLARRAQAQAGTAPDSMLREELARQYRDAAGQIIMATLEREIADDRQLQEVMTDFWFNHFNVFIGKNQDRYLVADYIERAIRPHALGRFEDLLRATARHPAMLVYLDNWQSVAPGATPPRFGRRPPGRMPTGLNENYARELLELHTLGVDGGYTQQDVENVARILTGWGIVGPARGGFDFEFHDWAHDRGEKTVLGVRFPAGHGEDEGLALLHMLAEHPATAHHIATQLCQRLVADQAPDGCVDAAAAEFLRTHGDIRAVLRAIVATEDFWAPANRAAKTKTPLEFVVSAMRVTRAQPQGPALALVLRQLGEPMFGEQVPTGYAETAEEWVNGGALLNRMNVAVALAAGRLPGVTVDLDSVIAPTTDRDTLVARVDRAILAGQGSEHTLRVIRHQIDDIESATQARTFAVGLALGSPDFQRQ